MNYSTIWIPITQEEPKPGQWVVIATLVGKMSNRPRLVCWGPESSALVRSNRMLDLHWFKVPSLKGTPWKETRDFDHQP